MQKGEVRARILASSDDDDLRLVYADLLQQEGDLQGELIVLQNALRAESDQYGISRDLMDRERAIRAQLVEPLLRDLPADGVALGWHLGFIDSLRIHASVWAGRQGSPAKETAIETRVMGLLNRLLPHRCAMLRELGVDAEVGFEHASVLDRILAHAPPLRTLALGSWLHRFRCDLSLLSSLPLRDLRLVGDGLQLDQLDLPRLSSLALRAPSFGSELDRLFHARLPGLESLSVEARRWSWSARAASEALELESLAPILAGTALPSLKRLSVRGVKGAAFLPLLVRSPLLAQLTELGTDDADETQEAIQSHREALAHVRLVASPHWTATELRGWGSFLETLGRPEEQRTMNARASALEVDPRTLCTQGKSLSRLGRRDEAIVVYDRAIELAPAHADAWYCKGVALVGEKKFEPASTCFREACRLGGPGGSLEPAAWANLGYVQQRLGRGGEAARSLTRALELYNARCTADPNDADNRYWKAATHALMGDKQSMLDELRRAVQADRELSAAARAESDFERFWGDPEFQQITRRF